MKRPLRAVVTTFCAAALVGCQLLGGGTDDREIPPIDYSGSAYRQISQTSGGRPIIVDQQHAGRELYYVVSNTRQFGAQSVTMPAASHSDVAAFPGIQRSSLSSSSVSSATGPLRRDFPRQFVYPDPHPGLLPAGVTPSSVATPPPEVGDRFTFATDDGPITATARLVVTTTTTDPEEWKLAIWVSDGSNGTIDDTMLNLIRDRYVSAVDSNIVDLSIPIFGEPWGQLDSDIQSLFISPDNNYIHILLYDINGNGNDYAGGFVVGYYWAKDNFIDAVWSAAEPSLPASNERLMFYMDAPLLADPRDTLGGSGTSWEPTDEGPQTIVSTLAHEHQHMVQFYQRVGRIGSGAYAIWLNELASMVAEDFLAQELSVPGPRAVDPTVLDAGSPPLGGRLSEYAYSGAVTSLIDWSEDPTEVLSDYATAYSFGAYLARVYGAQLFRWLLQEAPPAGRVSRGQSIFGYEQWSIEQAVAAVSGQSLPFGELLHRWGIAMLLSDDTTAPAEVRINSGTAFASSAAEQAYNLGSINAHHYAWLGTAGAGSGPLWPAGAVTLSIPASANALYYAGTVPAGGTILPFFLTNPADMRVSVFVRVP